MAKKMRRFLALVLALVLCAGQLAIPVSAAEEDENTTAAPEVTVDVVVTPVEGGTQTTTTTTTTSSDAGAGTTSNSTVTEVVTVTGGGTQTDVNTTWTSTDTQTSGSTTAGNPTVVTDTNVVTTTTGSEDSTQTVTYSGNTEITEGSLSGQETTDTVGKTTTTTTTTGEVVLETIVTEETETENLDETETNTNPDAEDDLLSSKEEEIQLGEEEEQGWVDGDIKEGTPTSKETVEKQESKTTLNPEYDYSKGTVTLEMTPEGTDTETKTITIDDLTKLKSLGKKIKSTIPIYAEDGETVIGWTVNYVEDSTQIEDTPKSSEITDNGTWESNGDVKSVYIDPGTYKTGSSTTGDNLDEVENGQSVTTKTEKIYGEDGEFEGYRITTTTTTKKTADSVDNSLGTNYEGELTPKTYDDVKDFVLPDKPKESSTSNKDGGTTNVTVSDLMEGNDHVGYTIVTTITNADGDIIRTETKNIYGTSSVTSTSETIDTKSAVERTVTTTVTTKTEVKEVYTIQSSLEMQKTMTRLQTYDAEIVNDADIYRLAEGENGGMYFMYEGKMYEVVEYCKVSSANLATSDTVSMNGYDKNSGLRLDGQKAWSEDEGEWKKITSGYSGESFENQDDTSKDKTWTYVGNGLYSAYVVQDGENHVSSPQMFAIKNGDETCYVYCAEIGVTAEEGSTRVENDETVRRLAVVAENGFWGTEKGIGSLEAVKQLMRDKKVNETYINRINAGMALNATQMAIWNFTRDPSDSGEMEWETTWYDYAEYGEVSKDDVEAIMALYNVLVDLADNSDSTVEAESIDKEDVKGASITLVGKSVDTDGKVKTDDEKNELYNSEIAFKLDVNIGAITGDLILEITDANNRAIGKYRLAGENSNFLSLAEITPNNEGVYTITNVELAEGVRVTLNLKNIQPESTVVFYTDAYYQDFIGLKTNQKEVGVTFDLEFHVTDPEIKYVSATVTTHRDDTQIGTQVVKRTDLATNTKIKDFGDIKTDVSHDIDVIATVTTTEIKNYTTKENRTWKENWKFLRNIITSEDTDTQDEEITLADAPKTGDVTALLAVVSGLSLGGMVLLRKRKEEE